MDEVSKLMQELVVAIKARIDATKKAEELAKEVLTLPKLSVVSVCDNEQREAYDDEEMLHKMKLKLELQNLNHVKESAVETIEHALNVVANTRWSVNAIYKQTEENRDTIIEDYKQKLEQKKAMYLLTESQKKEIILDLLKTQSLLENMQERANHILQDTKQDTKQES